MMKPIYLDYNGTTPIAPEVAAEMLPYLYEQFGNPSSAHAYGTAARQAVERARWQTAALLGCQPDEVVFTSGGTESNNHAIRGAAEAGRGRGNHLVISSVEHPAVDEVCLWLEQNGFRVSHLPVDGTGMVDPADLSEIITAGTILVSVMHANNEVGTIQNIPALADIAHRCGALVHTDAAQSVGKIPVKVETLGVDLLTVAGHKLYAPQGVGALFIRNGISLEPLMHGAGQEKGRRPGTENMLEIVGLGKACEIAERDLASNREHFQKMIDRLHQGLLEALGQDRLRLNGHPQERLPNTLSLAFAGTRASDLLAAISDRVAASAGAACHAGGVTISKVLRAMNVPEEWAIGTLRFSTGRGTTPQEIDEAVGIIAAAARQLRKP